MMIRIESAASLSVPLQLITSGWEQQPLFDIWRVLAGERLYTDTTEIPFVIAFYNWLFYATYALYAEAVMTALVLDEAWLPTVLRSFTLIGLFAGTTIAYLIFVRMTNPRGMTEKVSSFGCAVLLFFGPLVGFWGFTVRPDVWAMVCEILAVLLFWSLRSSRPVAGIVLAAACLFAAWSLKQSNIVTTVVIGLYLLRSQPRWHVVLYSALLIAGYALTFAIGGEIYIRSLIHTSEVSWNPGDVPRIAINFAVKSVPTLLAVLTMAIVVLRDSNFRRTLLRDPASRFALLGLAVTIVLTVPGTAKAGAAENYYFPVSFFLALTALLGLHALRSAGGRYASIVPWAASLGWGAIIVAIAMVMFGGQGVRSVAFQHPQFTARAACLADLPKPVLTDDQYLSLPWMNPSRPSFILNYNYPLQRAAGIDFEAGGIAGLIGRGYFASLALSHAEAKHDGAALSGYDRRPAPCAGLTIWLRKG